MKNYEERFRWKLWMFRRLYKRGYNRPDIVRLLRFIDWMMTLPPTMKEAFSYEWDKLEEEHKMTYMMDIERFGYGKGVEQEQKKRVIDSRDTLIEVINHVYQLTEEVLVALEKELEKIESPDVLRNLTSICLTQNAFTVFRTALDDRLAEQGR
ncbi:MAG: hypothetical protein AAF639_22865 [Chloroflexota bacterium]